MKLKSKHSVYNNLLDAFDELADIYNNKEAKEFIASMKDKSMNESKDTKKLYQAIEDTADAIDDLTDEDEKSAKKKLDRADNNITDVKDNLSESTIEEWYVGEPEWAVIHKEPKEDDSNVYHKDYGYGKIMDETNTSYKVQFGDRNLMFDKDSFKKGYLKKVESLTEDIYQQCRDDAENISNYLNKNAPNLWWDLVDYDMFPMNTSKVSIKIEGDWKHDHQFFKNLIRDWATKNNRQIFKIDEREVGNSESDYYTADYDIYITADKDSFDKLNSMRRLFGESLKESLSEEIEQQPDTIYKGITIEHFPLQWKFTDDDEYQDQDGYVIKSPYYLQSNNDKSKYYLPLYCEDERGKVLDFNTLEDAKKYVDDFIVPKKGKTIIKNGDEVHFEILPEFRKDEIEESLTEDLDQIETGMSSVLMDLINQEYSLLSLYESAQVTLEAHGEDRFTEIFDYIADDINIHIGMLEAAIEDVNPSSEKTEEGKEQAQLILDESLFE